MIKNIEEAIMPDKKQIIDFLAKNREIFSRKYHINKIGLFGSYARNEAVESSDIDIIVEFEENTQNIYDLKRKLAELLKNQFHKDIDIAREKYLKPRTKDHILKETLYVK
jgi:uncharacterized protein